MTPTKLPWEKLKTRIIRLYERHTLQEIGQRYEVSASSIQGHLHAWGITANWAHRSALRRMTERKAEIVRLLTVKRWPLRQVARRLGYSEKSLRRQVRAWNVQRQGPINHLEKFEYWAERKKRILRLYRSGVPAPVIAKGMGCSSGSVYAHLHAWGVKVRGKGSRWKLRVWVDGNGYARIGRRKRSHIVWEIAHGKPVPPEHVVHHKDGNRLNDVPSNLEALTKQAHDDLKRKGRFEGVSVATPALT